MTKLKEAHDNAEAAALNLEMALVRPGYADGLVRTARLQLNKALALLVECDVPAVEPERPVTVKEFKAAIGRVLESVAAERQFKLTALTAVEYDDKWLRALQKEIAK